MLNIIIIEDEKPVCDQLVNTITSISSDIQIKNMITSVKEGIEFMSGSPDAHLILSDVQLCDGLSFEIFKHAPTTIPIIFITGYNEFMLTAFSHNIIDYLLKPVSAKELSASLEKYRSFERHFTTSASSINNLIKYVTGKKKSRLLVRRGLENIVLKLEDIVLLYTENKMVYVSDKYGKKYIADKNLTDLEEELDDSVFFRVNRQYIVNMNYIKGYKPYEKVKLVVDLTLTDLNHVIIVSQETAPDFRKWMYEA
jgi:two-component system LytT family response regulator